MGQTVTGGHGRGRRIDRHASVDGSLRGQGDNTGTDLILDDRWVLLVSVGIVGGPTVDHRDGSGFLLLRGSVGEQGFRAVARRVSRSEGVTTGSTLAFLGRWRGEGHGVFERIRVGLGESIGKDVGMESAEWVGE